MKGYRFYQELENKNKKGEIKKQSVVAVPLQENGRGHSPLWIPGTMKMECIAGVFDNDNPPICTTSCSYDYLRNETRRISEEKARLIHPKLFEYLDY